MLICRRILSFFASFLIFLCLKFLVLRCSDRFFFVVTCLEPTIQYFAIAYMLSSFFCTPAGCPFLGILFFGIDDKMLRRNISAKIYSALIGNMSEINFHVIGSNTSR